MGMGLIPAAALIVLALPGNAALRIGVVLGLVAVVLIALSIPRRETPTGAVTQATFRMIDEKLRALETEVRALRADRADAAPRSAGSYANRPVPDLSAIPSSAARQQVMVEPAFAVARQSVVARQSAAARSSSGRAPVPSTVGRPEPDAVPFRAEQGSGHRRESSHAQSRFEAAVEPTPPSGPAPADERGGRTWRADDRWASVRDDAAGREVRVARRRVAVRTDETGTEMHLEDDWAALRRAYADQGERWTDGGDLSEPWLHARGRQNPSRGGRSAGADEEWSDRGLSARWEVPSSPHEPALDAGQGVPAGRPSTGRVWRPRVPAALPANGAAGSWRDGWAEPQQESAGRPRALSPGFVRSDARWG